MGWCKNSEWRIEKHVMRILLQRARIRLMNLENGWKWDNKKEEENIQWEKNVFCNIHQLFFVLSLLFAQEKLSQINI